MIHLSLCLGTLGLFSSPAVFPSASDPGSPPSLRGAQVPEMCPFLCSQGEDRGEGGEALSGPVTSLLGSLSCLTSSAAEESGVQGSVCSEMKLPKNQDMLGVSLRLS